MLTAVEAFEAGDELATEDSAQHLHGKEKAGVGGVHPAAVIGRDASRRDDAVDMQMSEQILAPGVENAEDADLGAQVLGVGRDFLQSGGAGREQEMVKVTRVVLRQEVEFVGDSEDDVKVGGRQ